MTETTPARARRIRFGDLLLEHGVITPAQFQQALDSQKHSGKRLGRVLVDLGYISEQALQTFLSQQLELPFVDLRQQLLDPQLALQLPEPLARRHRALLLSADEAGFQLGMADPTNLYAYDEIANLLRRPVRVALVDEAELLRALDRIYRRTEDVARLAGELQEEFKGHSVEISTARLDESAADAPVLRLIESLFEDALQVRASDIHIEPGERHLRLRQRVDGVLHEQRLEGSKAAGALVTRLKLMCGLDIAEKRLPQDGRFTVQVRDRRVDVRLSTLPTQFGESAVMRLLDQSAGLTTIANLGMDAALQSRFKQLLARTTGVILVVGPTGSGKTTTLYAALSFLNQADMKIITAEDPVEYRLDRVMQVQINPKIGLDFAKVLRTMLRQDPDVVLIGEMRDRETVLIGLRAAITGHQVFSTLHTSTALSAVHRLRDMGAEGYMIAAAVQAVVAQRLLRRLCRECAQPAPLAEHELAWARRHLGAEELANGQFRKAGGCGVCGGSGYSGRIAAYELLEFDRGISEAIRSDDALAIDRAVRAQAHYSSLTHQALRHAAAGLTSVAEVMQQLSGVDEISQPVDELLADAMQVA